MKSLGGGFTHFFIFIPKIGEDEPILTNISKGVKPPTRKVLGCRVSGE